MDNLNAEFKELLTAFDELELNNISKRRMAVKPLYDFFQKITMQVGSDYCNLNPGTLKSSHLKYRWEMIKNTLSFEGPEPESQWNTLIKHISGIRQKTEHNDEYDPPIKKLDKIREQAVEFGTWLFEAAAVYMKKRSNYSFNQIFKMNLHRYSLQARLAIADYGKETPHVAQIGYQPILEQKDQYQTLRDALKAVEEKWESFSIVRDTDKIERTDLDNLIKLIEISSILESRAQLLLMDSICPKCGGKIKESESYVGGYGEDPEPDGVVCRIGCENCDYELNQEFFSI